MFWIDIHVYYIYDILTSSPNIVVVVVVVVVTTCRSNTDLGEWCDIRQMSLGPTISSLLCVQLFYWHDALSWHYTDSQLTCCDDCGRLHEAYTRLTVSVTVLCRPTQQMPRSVSVQLTTGKFSESPRSQLTAATVLQLAWYSTAWRGLQRCCCCFVQLLMLRL